MKFAYIDHSFHKRTKSTEFFPAFLAQFGQVDLFWDDSWKGGSTFDCAALSGSTYDAIFFFQILYPVEILEVLPTGRVFLVPMYDGVVGRRARDWLPYRGFRFVNFSKTLHEQLVSIGIESFYLQYFPEPKPVRKSTRPDFQRAFFWERNRDVSFESVQRLFSGEDSIKLHHHFSPDPGTELVEAPLPTKVGWSRSHWFETREEYQALVDQCRIYVAPRRYEGIGMSFLEAMASGRVVCGLNAPTFSEYVTHGRTGILFQNGDVIDLDNFDLESIATSAAEFCARGRLVFQTRLGEMAQWVERSAGRTAAKSVTLGYVVAAIDRARHSVVNLIQRAKARLLGIRRA